MKKLYTHPIVEVQMVFVLSSLCGSNKGNVNNNAADFWGKAPQRLGKAYL